MSTADVPARESPNPSLPPASPGDSPGSPPAVPPVDPQPPAAGSSKKNEEIRSVAQLFFQLAGQREEQVAMRHRHREKQEWVDISWEEYARQVEQLAAALIALGIEPGDRVAILSNSRPEWAMSDLAIFAAAAVTTPIYQSNLPDEVQYILENSGSKIVFVEDREQLGKVLEVRGQLPALRHAVLYDGKVKNPGFILGYEELSEQGKLALQGDAQLVRRRTAVVDRCSQATFVYTSGTTGPPKGVVLTHENLLFEMAALEQTVSVDERDETLLFLPMAHIFARVGYLLSTKLGCTVAYAESIDRLLDNLVEIRPTFMFSVPRIYEKIYNKVVSSVQRGNRLTRQIFAFAIAIGRLVSKRRQQGRWIPPHLAVSFLVAEMLVFNKLKRRFGGKVRFFISGGAPLSREIAEFFHAAGLLVLEGYGLTETTAASHVNKLDAYRFGTVGPALPGVEVRIAGDGEILLRGANVFPEYHAREEATREALEPDGWFHTGDIGEVDQDGFLRITDRKKDLIVTSGGKNVAPQNIENLMKTAPMISQIMVYGDKRNYLSALVTLDPEEVTRYAEHKEIEWEEWAELCRHPLVVEKVDRQIQERNKSLASHETIKKFTILDKEFEIGEELTPTLKVKRKFATQKYWDILDSMYKKKE